MILKCTLKLELFLKIKQNHYKNHFMLVSQANWCNMTFILSDGCDLNQGHIGIQTQVGGMRQMTNQLSYPSPLKLKLTVVDSVKLKMHPLSFNLLL